MERVLLFCSSITLLLTAATSDYPPAFEAKVDNFLTQVGQCHSISSMSVSVVQFPSVSTPPRYFTRVYNFDPHASQQVTESTAWPLGELGEALSNLMLYRAYEDGLLDLQKNVDLPPVSHKVTVLDLLLHSSGISSSDWLSRRFGRTNLPVPFTLENINDSQDENQAANFRTLYDHDSGLYSFAVEEALMWMNSANFSTLLTDLKARLNMQETDICKASSMVVPAVAHRDSLDGDEVIEYMKSLGLPYSLCMSVKDAQNFMTSLLKTFISDTSLMRRSALNTMVSRRTQLASLDQYHLALYFDSASLLFKQGRYRGQLLLAQSATLLGSRSAFWIIPDSRMGVFLGIRGSRALANLDIDHYIAEYIASSVMSNEPLFDISSVCGVMPLEVALTDHYCEACLPPQDPSIAGRFVSHRYGGLEIKPEDDNYLLILGSKVFPASLCKVASKPEEFWIHFQHNALAALLPSCDSACLAYPADCLKAKVNGTHVVVNVGEHSATFETVATANFDTGSGAVNRPGAVMTVLIVIVYSSI